MRCVWIATAAVCLFAGCTHSPEKAATEAKRSAGSWGATLSAAAEGWGNGELSTPYFESVVTQARTSLKKAAQTARKSGGDSAAAPVNAVASHVAAIEAAVARGDRAAVIDGAHAAASVQRPQRTPPVARPQ